MASFDVVFTPSKWKSLFSGPSCIVSDWTSNIGTIGTTPLGGGSSLLIRTVVLLGGWPRGDGDLTLKKLAPLIFCRNHCLFPKSFYQIISGHDGSLRYSGKTYNTRHISWDSCDVFCSPNVVFGELASQKPEIQHLEGRHTTFFMEYGSVASGVPTQRDEDCRFIKSCKKNPKNRLYRLFTRFYIK